MYRLTIDFPASNSSGQSFWLVFIRLWVKFVLLDINDEAKKQHNLFFTLLKRVTVLKLLLYVRMFISLLGPS